MRFLSTLRFCLAERLRGGNRVSAGAYLKGVERIQLGRRCKIHSGASLDATRAGGIRLGDGIVVVGRLMRRQLQDLTHAS